MRSISDNPLGGPLRGEEFACGGELQWAWCATYRFIQIHTNSYKSFHSKKSWLAAAGSAPEEFIPFSHLALLAWLINLTAKSNQPISTSLNFKTEPSQPFILVSVQTAKPAKPAKPNAKNLPTSGLRGSVSLLRWKWEQLQWVDLKLDFPLPQLLFCSSLEKHLKSNMKV